MSSQLVLGVLDFGALLFISFYMFYKSPPLAGLVILLALLNVGITALSRGKLRKKPGRNRKDFADSKLSD